MICTDHQIFIIRVIKSRRMRWAGHVARMAEGRGACRVLVGIPDGTLLSRSPWTVIGYLIRRE
jgi:alkanesulfonate monooxygenase SsuD/methylene tetrahydromethanopterin reductase-like flavin-dependent oxidoreductase (luciferase family)